MTVRQFNIILKHFSHINKNTSSEKIFQTYPNFDEVSDQNNMAQMIDEYPIDEIFRIVVQPSKNVLDNKNLIEIDLLNRVIWDLMDDTEKHLENSSSQKSNI